MHANRFLESRGVASRCCITNSSVPQGNGSDTRGRVPHIKAGEGMRTAAEAIMDFEQVQKMFEFLARFTMSIYFTRYQPNTK